LNILITGINGFIAKNLFYRLNERDNFHIEGIVRGESSRAISKKIQSADFIFHLAGENRSTAEDDFTNNNHIFTKLICDELIKINSKAIVLFSSSTQATKNNVYGQSKKLAEDELLNLQATNKNPVLIYRLPGIFGKWAKPNYNSVVATFCHNIANNKEIKINNGDSLLELSFIDDVVEDFINALDNRETIFKEAKALYKKPSATYEITVNELAVLINKFKGNRSICKIDNIANGLEKLLYSTYLTYLPHQDFTYDIDSNSDERGIFTEFIKSLDLGQISFFTIKPNAVRGMHYHNLKIEKFLVVCGVGEFVFENIDSKEKLKFQLSVDDSKVIETIPGMAHSIKNIGSETLVVLAYANEVFDENQPDTYHYKINHE